MNTLQYIAQINNCTQSDTSPGCDTNLPQIAANESTLTTLLSVFFGLLAAIAVLIIVVQGIRFVVSQGDPQKAADARRGVIYAVVGLVIALSAEAVVRVTLGRL